MDFRHSSAAVAREGGSVADDDAAVSAAASLANEASVLFQSEKFGECVAVLNRLLQKKQDDTKKKSEDLARASREQADPTSQAANKAISGAKGNGLPSYAGVVFGDEFDPSVTALNIATILFQLHEYSKALSVLEPLFQNIEPIDETTALHICLLLLDVAFVTQDASKFSDVINYLEKAFGVSYMPNQADSGSTGQQQASNFVAKSALIPNNSSASDDLRSEGISTGSASEGSLSRTLSDDTMEYETLSSTLDISGQNISRPSNVSSSNDL